MNKDVQLANLPKPDALCPTGKVMIVSGWGYDFYNLTRNEDKLYAVKQQCLDISKCPFYIGDPKYALCVGDLADPDNSACGGDSGGNIILVYPLSYAIKYHSFKMYQNGVFQSTISKLVSSFRSVDPH